jgi:hypothetical protein
MPGDGPEPLCLVSPIVRPVRFVRTRSTIITLPIRRRIPSFAVVCGILRRDPGGLAGLRRAVHGREARDRRRHGRSSEFRQVRTRNRNLGACSLAWPLRSRSRSGEGAGRVRNVVRSLCAFERGSRTFKDTTPKDDGIVISGEGNLNAQLRTGVRSDPGRNGARQGALTSRHLNTLATLAWRATSAVASARARAMQSASVEAFNSCSRMYSYERLAEPSRSEDGKTYLHHFDPPCMLLTELLDPTGVICPADPGPELVPTTNKRIEIVVEAHGKLVIN